MLDPYWSPSHGELGDVHRHFGDFVAAARLYATAAERGAPYVGYHLLQAARCFRKVGMAERAIETFYRLATIAPDHGDVAREGDETMRLASAGEARRYAEWLRHSRRTLGLAEVPVR